MLELFDSQRKHQSADRAVEKLARSQYSQLADSQSNQNYYWIHHH